jgi:hypothetical protein
MKVLYIGQYGLGTTSRMRGEILSKLTAPGTFTVLDIEKPISDTKQIFRSFGWRYFKGPLISCVNKFIERELSNCGTVDLVWVDKGVFIDPQVVKKLKQRCGVLFHYTPDAAFYFNNSKLFRNSLPYYDFCISTKSFEFDLYYKYGVQNLIKCTQGYNPKIHHAYNKYAEKSGIGFLGLYEESRKIILHELIKSGFEVKVGGKGWEKFNRQHLQYDNYTFLGDNLYGESYASAISGCLFAMGLLSKKFPEKHTTRTFEIPACKTALVTEDNPEIRTYYNQDDVLFYSDIMDLQEKLQYYLSNKAELYNLIERGFNAVSKGCFNYECILKKVLLEAGICT